MSNLRVHDPKAGQTPTTSSSRPSYPVEIEHVTESYGTDTVVDDLSFTVRPGRVTGFLGPNGSGKSTTMKILLDLAGADRGGATIGGQRYRDLADPVRTPSPDRLEAVLGDGGAVTTRGDDNSLVVRGLSMGEIGERAFKAGIALHELSTNSGSLEDRFLRWTAQTGAGPTEADQEVSKP